MGSVGKRLTTIYQSKAYTKATPKQNSDKMNHTLGGSHDTIAAPPHSHASVFRSQFRQHIAPSISHANQHTLNRLSGVRSVEIAYF